MNDEKLERAKELKEKIKNLKEVYKSAGNGAEIRAQDVMTFKVETETECFYFGRGSYAFKYNEKLKENMKTIASVFMDLALKMLEREIENLEEEYKNL